MIAPFVLYFLMYAGFIIAAWITNGILDFFRKDSYTLFDRVATFVLLVTLFSTYGYFMGQLLHE